MKKSILYSLLGVLFVIGISATYINVSKPEPKESVKETYASFLYTAGFKNVSGINTTLLSKERVKWEQKVFILSLMLKWISY